MNPPQCNQTVSREKKSGWKVRALTVISTMMIVGRVDDSRPRVMTQPDSLYHSFYDFRLKGSRMQSNPRQTTDLIPPHFSDNGVTGP